MYFLFTWNEILTNIGNVIMCALRTMMLSICDVIYRLIIFCFNVFDKIGTAKLLDNETVNMLYEKVGLILGIYMIFRLTFIAVQYVLDPDAMTDKQKGTGKLLTKVIVVIILLGTTPAIFNMAYKLQSTVVKENVLGKIILNSDDGVSNFGGEMAWFLFSTFYTNNDKIAEVDYCPELIDTGNGSIIYNDFIQNSSLDFTYNCINERDTYYHEIQGDVETFIVDFEGLIAIVAGGVMLWIIVMYTISVGFRLVQLAFLQLIAPLPIMMYLEPKDDGPFQKWIKLCLSCYLDYFIRTAIIYFICFLINKIMDMDTSYFFSTLGSNLTGSEYRYIVVIMIFALLMFAKKLPELLKEVLPGGGNSFSDYGFSFKKRTDNMIGGSYINKGFKEAAKAIGLMPLTTGKKLISGIDSATHGKGFWNGYFKNPGKIGQWINKQRENLTPESYKASQERREGRENVNAIDDKWTSGVGIAKKLMDKGHFTGAAGANPWTEALDGLTSYNYELIFRHQEFIKSKMSVDAESNIEKELRHAKEALDMGAATATANGRTYNRASATDLEDLVKNLDKSQKTLKGLEEVHAEISKQYQDDAKVEREFKFIKNNVVNPANPSNDHTSSGIN